MRFDLKLDLSIWLLNNFSLSGRVESWSSEEEFCVMPFLISVEHWQNHHFSIKKCPILHC